MTILSDLKAAAAKKWTAAEIERLTALNSRLTDKANAYIIANARLAEDAARYRWLKAHSVSENDTGQKCMVYWCDFDHYNDVDASIDAAMKEAPP